MLPGPKRRMMNGLISLVPDLPIRPDVHFEHLFRKVREDEYGRRGDGLFCLGSASLHLYSEAFSARLHQVKT